MSTPSAVSKPSVRLSASLLSPQQQDAITQLYEGNRLIVGNMGSGKSVIAASAITELLTDNHLKRVLIITTPKIANTVWAQEFNKWEHTHHIDVAVATGSPEERLGVFKHQGQVVVATFNILPWIKDNRLFDLFDGLLIDETTKLKSTGGAQFKALRPNLKKFKWRAGLTGTPVSEDFQGLFGQMMIIDQGKALGTRKDTFLNHYFYPTDYKQYNWALKPGMDEEMIQTIQHLVHVVPDYRDTLPPITFHRHRVSAPADLMEYYNQMRNDMLTHDAVSATAAVLVQKLQQIASGFIYDEQGDAIPLSDFRLTALQQLLNSLTGNILIAYWYQEDLKRLQQLLPNAETLTPSNLTKQVERWNRGEIQYLLIHPRSAGHGLQLEQGGHTLVWYTPQWSNDLWEQTNARLWRKGQTHPVNVYALEAINTIDEAVGLRISSKAEFEKLFMKHLRGN